MRIFIYVSVCIALVMAAPQGYNYQIDVGIPDISGIQTVPNQYQQLLPPPPPPSQPQFVHQDQLAGQISQLGQTFASQQGGLQFGNQLLQNGQQVTQYEQRQQQQQLPAVQQQQFQETLIPPVQVAEPLQQQFVDIAGQSKPVESFDNQPQFIIMHRGQPQSQEDSQGSSAQKKVVFQKEFYYLSAPQEEYETTKELDDKLNTIKKNLRVVFIKAPENNGLEKAALQLTQQAVQDQTAIYVLTKQHDVSQLSKKLQAIKSSNAQRPEVIFIKYRTPEEAEHAQRVIQAQYESLDGPNHINRPNTAVAHDFVGSTEASGGDPRKLSAINGVAAGSGGKGQQFGILKSVSKYLPSSAKH